MSKKLNYLKIILTLWQKLKIKRRKQIIVTLILILFSGIADLLSIASVLPFIYIITSDPSKILEINLINNFFQILKIYDRSQIIITISLLFGFLAILSGLLKLLNIFINYRLSGLIGADFSSEYFFSELNRPYLSHIKTNSSLSITGITKYVDDLVAFTTAILDFCASVFTAIFIIVGLILIEKSLTIYSLLFFGSIYFFISFLLKKKVRRISISVANSKKLELKSITEGIGFIRDIILEKSQHIYLRRFKDIVYKMRINFALSQFLTFFPRYFIETIALILIALIVIFYSFIPNQNQSSILLLAPLAFGLQKLLPAFQKIYSSYTAIITYSEGANITLQFCQKFNNNNNNSRISKPFDFREKIVFEDVFFRYDKKAKYSLKGISLTIKKGQHIGIKGSTGAGKSTFLDVFMGFLPITSGCIRVDNKIIKSSIDLSSWQSIISHVPQFIYLSDATIAENVALEFDHNKIDFEKLEYSLKIAELEEFIKNNDNGILTIVGERGINLSGGQRQRIGIARAIYKLKKVLILDEATSSLDNDTEHRIISNLKKLNPDITVLMIAHRLSSLKNCDKILEINNGMANY